MGEEIQLREVETAFQPMPTKLQITYSFVSQKSVSPSGQPLGSF